MRFHRIVSTAWVQTDEPSLLTELRTHLDTIHDHFKANKMGNDCQYHIHALNHLFRGYQINHIPATPAANAYMIHFYDSPIKLEAHRQIGVSGALYESGRAATDHEYSVVPFINLSDTEAPIQSKSIIAEKTTLELYTIPSKNAEEIPRFLHKKYSLGYFFNEFALIEIGLWSQKQGHAVCYVYQKKGTQVDAYFCDPTRMRISNDARSFFSDYVREYPHFAKKLLFAGFEPKPRVKLEPPNAPPHHPEKRQRLGNAVSEAPLPSVVRDQSPTNDPLVSVTQNATAGLHPMNQTPLVDSTCTDQGLEARVNHYLKVCQTWHAGHTTLINHAKIGIIYRSTLQGLSVFFSPNNRSQYGTTGRLELVASNGDKVQMDLLPRNIGDGHAFVLDGNTQSRSVFTVSQWRNVIMGGKLQKNRTFLSETYRLAVNHPVARIVPTVGASSLDALDPEIITKINTAATLAHAFYEEVFQQKTICPNNINKERISDGLIYYRLSELYQEVSFEMIRGQDTCRLQFFLADTNLARGSLYITSQPPVDFFLTDWKLSASLRLDHRPGRTHWLSSIFATKENLIQKINHTIETCQVWHEKKNQLLRSDCNRRATDFKVGHRYTETLNGSELSFQFNAISSSGITGHLTYRLSAHETVKLYFTPRSVFRDSTHYYFCAPNQVFKFELLNGVVAENRLTRCQTPA